MAKIVGGAPPFIGTRDNLTIYLMNGEYIVRTKSSLTGKRVKRDPAFAKTMKYAGWLKQGARIASQIYRQLPADERVYKQYRELTGKAISLLKECFDAGDVITMLEAVYLPQPVKSAVVRDDRCNEYCNKHCNEHYNEYARGDHNGNSSSSSSAYLIEYDCEYTGKHNSECVKYSSGHTTTYLNEYDSRRVGKFNCRHCRECNCIRVKYNATSVKGANASLKSVSVSARRVRGIV